MRAGTSEPASTPIDPVHRAAIRLWEPIAGFAWSSCRRRGRGVVLVDRDDLVATAERAPDAWPRLPLSFVPEAYVPKGDDFAAIIARYDPRREVALLVGSGGGDEQLLVLSAADGERPTPEQCAAAAAEPTP